jgi:putative endonuclease
MWYAYVLESLKNQLHYVGSTGNLRQRFMDHNRKRGGKYSSRNALFKLIFYEAFIEKSDALRAEKFFKTGYGREVLAGKLASYIKGSQND